MWSKASFPNHSSNAAGAIEDDDGELDPDTLIDLDKLAAFDCSLA